MTSPHLQIVSGSGSQALASKLAEELSIPLAETELSRFPNEELRVRVLSHSHSAILVGSLSSPVNSRLVELILLADALKRMGTTITAAVVSWYAYSKQDKVFLPGEPLSAKVVSSLLQTTPIPHLYTVDLHNPSIAGYFDIPVTNTNALPIFVNHFKNYDLTNTVVISPDAGSIKISTYFAQSLGVPIVYASKKRDLVTGEVETLGIDQSIEGKNVMIIDDMIATGSTLVSLSEFLKKQGAKKVTVCATHHLYIEGVQAKLNEAPIDELWVTDTVEKPSSVSSERLKILSVAPLLADVIRPKIS